LCARRYHGVVTLVCVPITVERVEDAIADAAQALEHGADLVEYRVDLLFETHQGDTLGTRIERVLDLVARSPGACVVACRPHWEGGEYHGEDADRIALIEALATGERPPSYIDIELATLDADASWRARVRSVVALSGDDAHKPRLICSAHDFEGRPSDLTRRVLAMYDEPACSVVKIAHRARTVRDNIELFDLLRGRRKPMIALAMGDTGLMSRVLAAKFGAFMTFTSLREGSETARGQPTLADLLGMYRFRSIGEHTKVVGVMGWPIAQSMSPLVHNAGFARIGFDGVYLPLPVEPSAEAFKATTHALLDYEPLTFHGASVTIPHKEHLVALATDDATLGCVPDPEIRAAGAANTLCVRDQDDEHEGRYLSLHNTDMIAIATLLVEALGPLQGNRVLIVGAGGAARSAAFGCVRRGAEVMIHNRTRDRAQTVVNDLNASGLAGRASVADSPTERADAYINATPIGMVGGPDPEGLAIPIRSLGSRSDRLVVLDTVYNPIETPMIRAAKEHGYHTIDGVRMFARQAKVQFELWTGVAAPKGLFSGLVRDALGGKG